MNILVLPVRTLILFVFITSFGLGLLTSSANAHTGVSASNPSNGSQIKKSPDVATLEFNALVDLDTAEAQLRYIGDLDTPLAEVANRKVKTISLVKSSGTRVGSTASFNLPELPSGLYALDWSVNENGGHPNQSTIIFKVTGSKLDISSPILLLLLGSVFLVGLFLVLRRLGKK